MTSKLRTVSVILVGLFLLGQSTAFAGSILGQISSEGVVMDGTRVPSGTTLLDDSLLRTGTSPAVVHLENGNLLRLESHSSVHLAGTTTGNVEVAVQSGELSFRDRSGEVVTIAQNDLVVLDQEGQVKEGAPVKIGEEVRLCKLENPVIKARCHADPRANGCQWTLIEMTPPEVQGHLDQGAVYAGNNAFDLDMDCQDVLAAPPPPTAATGGGRLSTTAWVGIGLGAAGLTYVIIDELDENEASPVTP